MLDGWSGALILYQVFDHYEALGQNHVPPPAPTPTYQTYIRWLKQQDEVAAAQFWKDTLAGFEIPTPLSVVMAGIGNRAQGANSKFKIQNSKFKIQNSKRFLCSSITPLPVHPSTHPPIHPSTHPPSLTLSPAATTHIQTLLRSHRLTLSTLMQGVWGLLLYRYSGKEDVLFGTTVSGRQGDLPGVEAIAGLLINVLPVRGKVIPDQSMVEWLQALQTQQAAANRYAYASPAQIQGWSQVQGRLFESLLVIENYPVRETESECSLQVDNIQSGIVSTYGLTLIVKPGERLQLMAIAAAEEQSLKGEALVALLEEFQAVLEAIVNTPQQLIRAVVSPHTNAATQAVPTLASVMSPNLNRAKLEGHFFTPNNPLELQLTQIWASVLGVYPLSVEASFFDMGGDSLLAVQLFNQMQQQLNCTLPLSSLFQAPNVRQFAALLSQAEPVSQWSSLVPIQTNGSRPPLFFHGGSADALTWAEFSYRLGVDQPFYALQRPDLDGSDVTLTTVEALATACIEEMRMVQPQGPYLVGGHCFGGAVAFEIAQQLQAQGEDLLGLVLIDAYCPASLPDTQLVQMQTRFHLGVFWLRKNYYYHGGLAKLSKLPGKIWQRLKPASKEAALSASIPTTAEVHDLQYSYAAVMPSVNLPAFDYPQEESTASNSAAQSVPYEYRYARAQDANEIATANYSPQPYAGRIKLFRADIQMLEWYFGPALGWQTVAKDKVGVTQIPGFFGNLFNHQSGPLLARQVKAYLATIA